MTGSRMRNARDARRTVSWTDFDAFDTQQQLWSFARDESSGESDERAALVRNAVRAARPTSSGLVFKLSSSSITVNGMTTSTPAKL